MFDITDFLFFNKNSRFLVIIFSIKFNRNHRFGQSLFQGAVPGLPLRDLYPRRRLQVCLGGTADLEGDRGHALYHRL